MKKWCIRLILSDKIAYHNRMANIYMYTAKQKQGSYIPDIISYTDKGCDILFRQQWHIRYSQRLTKLLTRYQ